MFKLGDSVRTHFGEVGQIVGEYPYREDDSAFDWWVDITFQASNGKTYTVREMYRNSELVGV